MFGPTYFGPSYFGPSYFGTGGDAVVVVTPIVGKYGPQHASALTILARKGSPVTFTIATPSYDAATDTATVTESTAAGQVVRLPGDRKRYEALNLRETDAITLLVALATYGANVTLGSRFTYGGQTWTVRAVDPLQPDGTTILSTVVGAR